MSREILGYTKEGKPIYPIKPVVPDAISTLIRHASGEIHHANLGLCPDEIEGHDSRDPECQVCQAMVALSAAAPAQGQQVEWQTTAVMLEQANAGLAQLNGKLRAELAALKAQQEPVAWRVTGADALTVTPEYPKWAEDDSRLLIESLYTTPQPAPAQDVAGEIRELLVEMVNIHRRRGVVLTIHIEQIADILDAHNKQSGEKKS